MVAHVMQSPRFFKQSIHVDKVKVVKVSSLERKVKTAVEKKYAHLNTVSLASNTELHGTSYSKGMMVSVGHCGGLPEFAKIHCILLVDSQASFVLERFSSWYVEHVRAFKVEELPYENLIIAELKDLNDFYPLAAYSIGGNLMVSPKCFFVTLKFAFFQLGLQAALT